MTIARVLFTLFVGLMIASCCTAFVPALSFASARFVCDGDFSTSPPFRQRTRFYCTDPQTQVKTEINSLKVIGVSTLVYSALLILPISLLAGALSRSNARIEAAKQATLAAAIPAQATVVGVAETGRAERKAGRTTRDVGLKLTLDVEHPQRGTYRAETIWMVSELHFSRVQPGEVVPVKINAEVPERIYPNADWAEFSDWKMVKNEPHR